MHGHHYRDVDCGPSAWRGSDCRHRYIGFCRCGRGPHAYYIGEDGKIRSPVLAVPEAEEKISELEEQIKRLRDDLQNAMSEIERLKGIQPKDH